jgi:hypothetical protein
MSSMNKYGGGGSNILRGGKRTYNSGTLLGNFVEESHKPGLSTKQCPGLLVSPVYMTSTQDQMNAVKTVLRHQSTHQHQSRYDYNNLIGPDREAGASTWKSLTQSAHGNVATPTEFAAPRAMKAVGVPPEDLEKYRQKWTKEQPSLKSIRFMSEAEATHGGVVPDKFKPCKTKPLES